MGEILTEKSGNLNLGVPGIMYLGGIAGLVSTFYYENVYCVGAGVSPNVASAFSSASSPRSSRRRWAASSTAF
jgi:ABC-type uncharacterized transport system permease subunit